MVGGGVGLGGRVGVMVGSGARVYVVVGVVLIVRVKISERGVIMVVDYTSRRMGALSNNPVPAVFGLF